MNKYDIYWAYVYFQDIYNGKRRPVIQLDNNTFVPLIAPITSHTARDKLDYSIKDWREAGLTKPSTIRLSKRIKLNKTLLDSYIGKLSIEDSEELDKLIESITSNGKQVEQILEEDLLQEQGNFYRWRIKPTFPSYYDGKGHLIIPKEIYNDWD